MSATKQKQIHKQYETALDSLVEKIKQDRRVLAAILFGSMSYDEVWLNSDIDLWIIMEDDQKQSSITLCENDINIHAQLIPRTTFKRRIEGDLTGGWLDFSFSKSTLLFTKDESIEQWFENIEHIGTQDKAFQLLRNASELMGSLNKAHKYFDLKEDYEYSFWWLMHVVRHVACIEVLWNDVAPAREVIHQAIEFNAGLFSTIYNDFVNQPKSRDAVEKVLETIELYLEKKSDVLFAPLLDYLTEEMEVRTLSEINDHFRKKLQGGGLEEACEWLTRNDMIEKLSNPIHLTEKSRIEVEEPAYYYDADAMDLT